MSGRESDPDDAQRALSDMIAVLLGLGADDGEALERVREGLAPIAESALLPPSAAIQVHLARTVLAGLADGSLTRAEARLDEVREALERALHELEAREVATPAPPPLEPEAPARLGPEPPAPAAATPAPQALFDRQLAHEFLAEARDQLSSAEAALLLLESDPRAAEALHTAFRGFHTIKSHLGMLGHATPRDLAHGVESLLARVRDERRPLDASAADLALAVCDAIDRFLRACEAGAPEEWTGGQLLLDRLRGHEVGCPPASQGPAAALDAESVASATDADGRRRLASAEGVDETVRVRVHRLDALLNLVGELAIAQAMVSQDVTSSRTDDERLVRDVAHATKIAAGLQDLSMALRMIPMRALFRRLSRLVRDLGRQTQKPLHLLVEGEETEIDRNMVESLADPLLHMVRNAVDHGIEAPEVRRALGKPEVGTIRLRASHVAGRVVLELSDDGRGLDPARILAKARLLGLVEEGQEPSEAETLQLILRPGVTTAREVTDLSGRGVGMDVVRRGVEALRGRIEIASVPDQGATFTLRLPLTLAVMDAMLVRVGGERYLLPTVALVRSFQPAARDLTVVAGRGEVVRLKDALLPLLRLGALLDVQQAVQDPCEGLLVVVEVDGRRFALLVDGIVSKQQVVIKPLGHGLTDVPGLAGGAILGDDRVALILDPPGLVRLASAGDSSARGRAGPGGTLAAAPGARGSTWEAP